MSRRKLKNSYHLKVSKIIHNSDLPDHIIQDLEQRLNHRTHFQLSKIYKALKGIASDQYAEVICG